MMLSSGRGLRSNRAGVTCALLALLCAGIWSISGCSHEPERVDADGRPTVLRFADTGIEGMEELRRAFGPFVDELRDILGVEIEFFPVSSRTIAVTALAMGQVDLVLAGPTEYLFMKSRHDVRPVVGIQRERYSTVFVVEADSDMQTLADVRGRRIALKDHGSTSGHVMPLSMLREAGINPDRDVRILMLGGARHEAMLSGEVDVLAGGIRDWDRLVERGGEGRFRIIAESPQLPRDLLVARNGISQAYTDEIAERILASGERLMNAMVQTAQRDRYARAAFVPASDADYDHLREAHRALGLPFDE